MSSTQQGYLSITGPYCISPDTPNITDLTPPNMPLRNATFFGTVTAGAFVTSGGGTPGPATFSQITITQGTLVAQAAGLQHTVTWNNAAVTFTAQTIAVTDTASSAGSLIAAWNVNGSPVFSIDKMGAAIFGGGIAYQPIVVFRSGTTPCIALDRSGVAGGGIATAASGDTILAVSSFVGASLVFKTGVTYNGDYGTTGAEVGRFTAAGDFLATAGNVLVKTAGKGLQIKSGPNSRIGTATLIGGTVTVANTSVTASTLGFVTRVTAAGTIGSLTITLTAGVGFTITSSNALDTSTIAWMLVEEI